MTKIPETSDFWKFHAIFVYFTNDLVAWNVKDVQQGKHRCPEVFLEEVRAICAGKMHQIHIKIDKKTKKFRVSKIFSSIFVFFSKDLVAQNPTDFQQGNKRCLRCPGGIFEEVKAICAGKMHQIHIKIDKKTKKFRFSKILFSFCVFFYRLGGSESHRRSTRKQFVVRVAFLKR